MRQQKVRIKASSLNRSFRSPGADCSPRKYCFTLDVMMGFCDPLREGVVGQRVGRQLPRMSRALYVGCRGNKRSGNSLDRRRVQDTISRNLQDNQRISRRKSGRLLGMLHRAVRPASGGVTTAKEGEFGQREPGKSLGRK